MKNQNTIGGAINIEETYQAFSQNSVPREIRKSINFNDQFCYIFTSGTTGKNMFLYEIFFNFTDI